MDLLLVLFILGIVVLTLGVLLEKTIKMPWMFSLVIFGMIISPFNFFPETVNSPEFKFISQLGMLGFLFLIGLNLNLEKIKKLGGYILFTTISLALTEVTIIAMIIYFFFPADVSYSLPIAILVGYGFGTIGEVVLLAILMEFKIEHTKFGQITLGTGVFDDIIEIFLLASLAVLPELSANSEVSNISNFLFVLINLGSLILLLFINIKIGKRLKSYLKEKSNKLPSYIMPFMILSVLFLYCVFGGITSENLGFVGAVFGGIAIKAMLPERMLEKHHNLIRYGFMFIISPAFFFSMGYHISLFAILVAPLLIIGIVAISLSVRVSGSTLIYRKILGTKEAALLGVGLCAKFSTSIIILTILYNSGLLSEFMFSVLMGAFLIMKPIIVIIYSKGVSKYLAPKVKNELIKNGGVV